MSIAIKTPVDPLAAWQPHQMTTEKLSTQSATTGPNPFALAADHVSAAADLAQADGAAVDDDEEPYTLTCICGISEDDGSTIQCERCDSWQHINCYYPDLPPFAASEADFHHTCADCKPRQFDRPRAAKRMQIWLADRAAERAEHEAAMVERKPVAKRPHAKAPKKKLKPIDVQTNGGRDSGKHGSPSDHALPAPKKTKTSHRPSQSMSALSKRGSPPHAAGRTAAANQSAARPPSPASAAPDLPDTFKIHSYSPAFFALYSGPPYELRTQNSFANINVPSTLASWITKEGHMKADTGRVPSEALCKSLLETTPRPRMRVEDGASTAEPGVEVHWRFLRTDDAVPKDMPMIELNGVVGFQSDYCSRPNSYWSELTSPLPFVFFHPLLPLYIDSRKEGSDARFVRRSCRPNSKLQASSSAPPSPSLHFWLVSDRDIAAGEQVTLPWDFRLHTDLAVRWLHLLDLDGGNTPTKSEGGDMTDDEYTAISEWLHRVLSEFGGCACDLGNDCAFARFHRNHLYAKSPTRPPARKKAASKKAKQQQQQQQQAVSPGSNGRGANSRAASESHADGGAVDEFGRSGSEPSKPPSRDRTPARQGSFDQTGLLIGLTDRDKRKVAMAEDTFRRMEQQPLNKKKRRGPDASAHSQQPPQHASKKAKPSSAHTTVDAAAAATAAVYSHAGTSTHEQSASPVGSGAAASLQSAPAPRARAVRVAYVESCAQTDPELYLAPPSSRPQPPHKRIISLSRRFLDHRHQTMERRRSQSVSDRPCTPASAPTSMELDSPQPSLRPSTTPEVNGSPASDGRAMGPGRPTDEASTTMGPPPHPDASAPTTNGSRTKTALHVQPPPVPLFTQSPSGAADGASLLTASPASLAPSPRSAGAFAFNPSANPSPSPIRKKLSLSDYTRRNKGAGKPGLPSSANGPRADNGDDGGKGERPTLSGTDRAADA
jgi:hypothetical protein